MKTILNKKPFVLYLASYFLNLIFLLPFAFILITCSTNDPPPVEENKKITLSVDEVTTTEVWLKLVTQNIELPKELTLLRDGDTTDSFILSVSDTVVYQSSLLPSSCYNYKAVIEGTESNELTVATMDTTSHDYSWEEITLGEFQSSLYDVWGTDENNVYAVGGVIIDGESYGVLHYDGTTWNKIQGVGGYAVYGFGENDIWVVGARVFNYNGVEWERIDGKTVDTHSEPLDTVLFENGAYYSVWGTSSSDLYLGSTWGKIIHWDGSKGEIVKEFPDLSVRDIFGLSKSFILTSVRSVTQGEVHLYNGTQWQKLKGLNENIQYESVYAVSQKEYYVVGEELLRNINGVWSKPVTTDVFLDCIRGNNLTVDIAAVGHFATLYHYNGYDWKKFQFSLSTYNVLTGVYLTENKVFVVGSYGNQARIIIGSRN